MSIKVTPLLELLTTHTSEFGFDSAFEIEMPDEVGLLFVGLAAFVTRIPPGGVHLVLAEPLVFREYPPEL